MTVITCPNCGAKNRVDERKAAGAAPKCGRCGAALPLSKFADDQGVLTVTDANFAVSTAGERPILIDCWAVWCPPCRMIAPIIDQLAAESGGRYRVGKLNVDENPATAGQFRIESIPTLLIFKQGRLVDSLVGLVPKTAIAQKLAQWSNP